MKELRIVDSLFAHAKYSTDFQESKYITWNRNKWDPEICFWTDSSLENVTKTSKYNFAWLLESYGITSPNYEWIRNNYQNFELVFTHEQSLLDKDSDKFKFIPTGGCWIKPTDQKIYSKSRLVSIIASPKRFLDGHMLRHQIIQKNNRIDVYGRAYRPIDYKLIGLKDYMFSLAIENTKRDFYFTEKLIDCFRTGTVPVFWGCPSIANFFNTKGMLIVNNLEEMNRVINSLDGEKYKSMIDAIQENFETAYKYIIAEDYIYENYLKNYLKDEG